MVKKNLEVINESGVHARPSRLIVLTSQKFKSKISLKKENGEEADAKSILSLMLLIAGKGSKLVLTAEGEDEIDAANEIEQLFLDGFSECYE